MDVRGELRDGGVGLLELHRPDQMNALTVDLVTALGGEAERLVADGAKALVLAGRGPAFCAGADLGLVRQSLDGDPHAALEPLVAGLHASIRRLQTLPVATVAAVEGPAVGAGLGLALTTDLRVVAEGARLIPGYMGIGSSPDGGVSWFLVRALGRARAQRLLLLNETVTAQTAHELGLADEVVADGTAVDAAIALARRVVGLPAQALVRVRELTDAASRQELGAHLDHEQRLVTELWDTHDFREGVSAFVERRSPQFTGR
jgi:2-(1,2-epoxy-1,2-dihydrophenyl)acetyl-CoA isomerase